MSFVADLSALVASSIDHRHHCPDGWLRAPLGSVAKIINGFPFKSGGFGTIGHSVIRIRDVARGFSNTRFDGEAPDGYWVEAGDLIVGMDGDFHTAFWRSERALLNQRVCKIVPDEARIDRRYLAYALPAYLELINANTPSVTVKHLSSRTLASIPLPLPAICRQKAVADRIDELFADIDNGEAALARARDDLATWRKALLKAAVTGELTADWRAANPPTETGADFIADILVNKKAGGRSGTAVQLDIHSIASDLPSLPADWAWSTVGQIAHVTGGITKNAKRDALALRVPYLRVGNVYARRMDLTRMETIGVSEGEAARSAVKDGDLLIVEGNGSIDQIGRSAIWDGQIDPCLHQNHLIKVRISERRIAEWVQVWLQSPSGRKELEAQASSTSGLHTLSISKVAGLRCPVPPLAELEASLSLVQRLTEEATAGGDDMTAMASSVGTLRQSVLVAAFRGELA